MISLLPKRNLVRLLSEISSGIEVIAPVNSGAGPAFETWEGAPLALEENPLASPMEFLLPRSEVLFRYIQFCGRYSFERDPPNPRLVFGVRPCDVRACVVMDRIMGEQPSDGLYFERRRSTLIAALSCTAPCDGGFCRGMGSGPGCDEGYDILLTDLGSSYLVESGSAAGVVLMREHIDLLEEAPEARTAEKDRLMEDAAMSMNRERTPEAVARSIKSRDWEKVAGGCISCGGCSFVCPVCHCFTILDRGVPDGERLRCRDSCILSGFSRMTSGANPRKSRAERIANRYREKFEHMPARTGIAGCIGCGRCEKVCPGGAGRWSLL